MSNIPNGKYRAKAKEWLLTEIGANATPAVSVDFVFSDPELGKIIWDGWLTDAAADRTLEALRYCGWEGTDINDLQGLDANEVELVIEQEDYNGRSYPKVKWVNRAGGLAHKTPLVGDKARAFAQTMKDRIRALDAAKGTRPAAKSQSRSGPAGPDAPPLTDDDLGF